MKRRDFNKMVLAAAGGILAGTTFGCGSETKDEPKKKKKAEKHACKGLNSCKGNGGCHTDKNACKGQNDCKGKGGCATVQHECKGKNGCKGQGGCKTGDNGCKGKNSCKGKGGCKVTLHTH